MKIKFNIKEGIDKPVNVKCKTKYINSNCHSLQVLQIFYYVEKHKTNNVWKTLDNLYNKYSKSETNFSLCVEGAHNLNYIDISIILKFCCQKR